MSKILDEGDRLYQQAIDQALALKTPGRTTGEQANLRSRAWRAYVEAFGHGERHKERDSVKEARND